MNYQAMEIEFQDPNGKVVLRDMTNEGPQIITAKQMEVTPKQGEIICMAACRRTSNSSQSSALRYDTFSRDWRAHLLVEYSKNKYACELLDGLIHDDRY